MSIYIFLRNLIIACYFVPASMEDLKTRKLDLGLLAAFSLPLIILTALDGAYFVSRERLAGLMVGAVLLVIAFISREAVGKGDGLAVMWLGYATGLGTVISALFAAWGLAFICALIMTAAGKKKRIPFIPFLGTGFLMVFADALL